MFRGDFIDDLPKIYGIYTGGFVVFIVLMAILEQAGVSTDTIGILFVGFTVLIYAVIGWLSRTTKLAEFYIAGRHVPPVFNGMATAADWMSGAVFVALAGGIYFGGHGYLAFIIGWTGGYVLVNALMAPYLRKFGCYTVPDFIGTRYGGGLARFIAVLILAAACFTYVVAQLNATGTIAARALEIPFEIAVWVGLLGILVCSLLGGMQAVTWTQVAQYIVLIIAYLTPVIWMAHMQGYGVVPHVTFGDAAARVAELEATLGIAASEPVVQDGLQALAVPQNAPAGPLSMETWQFVALTLCLMAGTASLPHILMRYFTTPSVRDARKSVAWSLLFIVLLYLTAPVLATLTKLQLLDPEAATAIVGKAIEEVMALDWVQKWSAVEFLKIDDLNGDGTLQVGELFMRSDIVVLAAPEIAGLPYVISGLVAAGALAAALSTADALLLAIANAFSHDVYHKIVSPAADTRRRLLIARILLILIGVAAALVAGMLPAPILDLVAWSFSFACSGLFFPIILGIWWKRANTAGGLAGMVVGFAAGAGYFYTVAFGGMEPWYGIDSLRFGIVGMAASLISMIVVTLLTPAPDEETQIMVEEIRKPSGRSVLAEVH